MTDKMNLNETINEVTEQWMFPQDKECEICMELKSDFFRLPCCKFNHEICVDCALHISDDNNVNCPFCRANLVYIELDQRERFDYKAILPNVTAKISRWNRKFKRRIQKRIIHFMKIYSIQGCEYNNIVNKNEMHLKAFMKQKCNRNKPNRIVAYYDFLARIGLVELKIKKKEMTETRIKIARLEKYLKPKN